VFTGGVAKNIGVKNALESGIGLPILVPEEPQIMGALGAALLAGAELRAAA
jgi:activator of 2-hydroxyglutaryl-CoA dehydratase